MQKKLYENEGEKVRCSKFTHKFEITHFYSICPDLDMDPPRPGYRSAHTRNYLVSKIWILPLFTENMEFLLKMNNKWSNSLSHIKMVKKIYTWNFEPVCALNKLKNKICFHQKYPVLGNIQIQSIKINNFGSGKLALQYLQNLERFLHEE